MGLLKRRNGVGKPQQQVVLLLLKSDITTSYNVAALGSGAVCYATGYSLLQLQIVYRFALERFPVHSNG